MKIHLSYVADEEFLATNDTQNTLPIDMHGAEQKSHFSPLQLLLAATVSCAAVDIVSMIKKKRKIFVDLQSSAEGVRNETHPRYFTAIHVHYTLISPDTTQEELEKVVVLAIEKYCSVAATIGMSILTHSCQVIAPPAKD